MRTVRPADEHTARSWRPGQECLDEASAWFPDGARPAVQGNRAGTMELRMMTADGSNPRQVAGLPATGAEAPGQPKKP